MNNVKTKWIYTFFLISILIFSGFIYLYDLGKESLTTDEYFSLHVASQPLNEIIFGHEKESNPNTLPPLYEIIMHLWLAIFGSSEFVQRSLSALLGIISVYILYRLATLLFDIPTGIIAALFGCLSFSWFSFFRLNRCYSLFIFLTLLSFYVFFYYLRNKDSKLYLPILTVINIALLYTHYFSFLVFLLELLFSFLEWKANKQFVINILFMCFMISIVYMPWYPNLFYDINKDPMVTAKHYYNNIWQQLFRFVLICFYDFHIKWDPVLTILYLPLLVIGCVKLIKEREGHFRYRPLYLALIFFIPLTIIYSFTYSDRVRYYAPFSFPLLILLAFGIRKMNTQRLNIFFLFPILACIAAVNLMDFYDFYHTPFNENWKQAVQYIKEIPDYQNKEMVFIFQTKYNPPVFAYYYWGNSVASAFVDKIVNNESYEDDLRAIKTKHKVYFINDTAGMGKFFKRLNLLPDNAWIWIFRYHDIFFDSNFRMRNKGKYLFRKIALNPEMPQIDFYLLRKIR